MYPTSTPALLGQLTPPRPVHGRLQQGCAPAPRVGQGKPPPHTATADPSSKSSLHPAPQEPPHAASRAWGQACGQGREQSPAKACERSGSHWRTYAPSARGGLSGAKGQQPGSARSPHVQPVTAVAVQNPRVGEGKPAPPARQERGEKAPRPGCPWLPRPAVGAANTSEPSGETADPSLHPHEPTGPEREAGRLRQSSCGRGGQGWFPATRSKAATAQKPSGGQKGGLFGKGVS